MTNFKVGDKFILKESGYYRTLIGEEFEITEINYIYSYPIKAICNNIKYHFSEEYDVLEKIEQDPIKLLFNHLKTI
jgi:hypothetical protein